MITSLRLHHFARLQLPESVLEIGERTLSLSNGGIVPPQHLGVAGRLAEELGRLKDLALGLDTFVDVLDLLVQLVRLCAVVSNRSAERRMGVTMAAGCAVPPGGVAGGGGRSGQEVEETLNCLWQWLPKGQ